MGSVVSGGMPPKHGELQAIVGELNAVRDRGPANLDSSANAAVVTTELDSLDAALLPDGPGLSRSLRITRLLRHGIGKLESTQHRQVLTIVFGLADEYDNKTPPERRILAAKYLDVAPHNFKRKGGKEDRALEALAAVLWHQATAADDASDPEPSPDGTSTAASSEPEDADNRSGTARRTRRRRLIVGGFVLAVLLIGGGAILAVTHGSSLSAQQQAGSAPPGLPSGSTGQRFAEQQGNLGTDTYSNPLGGAADGPPVGPLQRVEVSCKVYAVPFPSALPDGYFYRLEGAPWFGRYYAVANSFLNGDPVSGRSGAPTNTDPAVPDCPTS